MAKENEIENKEEKVAKKANNTVKKGRTPSFATFLKKISHGTYKYNKKRNVIRYNDGSCWRNTTEDGIFSRLAREYYKAYPAK